MNTNLSDPSRKTSGGLLSIDEALARIFAAVTPVRASERLPTLQSINRVLAVPCEAAIDVPTMDNSAMDGYAVRCADCADAVGSKVQLPVSQRIAAGQVGLALEPGTAARIFTGAMIPQGADAVVMQERCTALDEGRQVRIEHVPAPGENIRKRGEDIGAGTCILDAGMRLRPQELGLAASVGIAQLTVTRRLRVAVFFTGDELAMPGEVAPDQLNPGAIYNSNRFLLRGLLEDLGCEITDLGILPDNLAATRDALRAAAKGYDCIVSSGGVSVGEEDHVKAAVEAEGTLNLWKIAIKPGKPLAFGRVGEALFFGLPGNPVSSFITFLIFVRPALLRMQGVRNVAPRSYAIRADFDWLWPDARQEYLRVAINAQGGLDLFAQQGSGVLSSAVWGDGLLENPPGRTIARGDWVRFIPFSELR